MQPGFLGCPGGAAVLSVLGDIARLRAAAAYTTDTLAGWGLYGRGVLDYR